MNLKCECLWRINNRYNQERINPIINYMEKATCLNYVWTKMKLIPIQNLFFTLYQSFAQVAELVDALDSKSSVLNRRAGSIPALGTLKIKKLNKV